MSSAKPLRVCLAASGGGHLQHLLDFEDLWKEYDVFVVTEQTGYSEDLGKQFPTFFVDHIAMGQARLTSPIHLLKAAWRNFVQSARIVLRQRPQVVITTGAGAAFFTVFWARLAGAKILVIESFARFNEQSLFGKLAGPLAHKKVLQSASLRKYWPDAPVIDPLRILDGERPPKQKLIFVTVGATLVFDRLVRTVAELKASGAIEDRVVIQTGVGGWRPEGIETHETLSFEAISALLRDADIVICHGGTGSLITALREGCRTIAMPRLARLGEHYDDHQAEITEAFAKRGLIMAVNSVGELKEALDQVRERPPIMATSDPTGLRDFLRDALVEWS